MPKDRKNILGKVGDVFHMDKIGKPYVPYNPGRPSIAPSPPVYHSLPSGWKNEKVITPVLYTWTAHGREDYPQYSDSGGNVTNDPVGFLSSFTPGQYINTSSLSTINDPNYNSRQSYILRYNAVTGEYYAANTPYSTSSYSSLVAFFIIKCSGSSIYVDYVLAWCGSSALPPNGHASNSITGNESYITVTDPYRDFQNFSHRYGSSMPYYGTLSSYDVLGVKGLIEIYYTPSYSIGGSSQISRSYQIEAYLYLKSASANILQEGINITPVTCSFNVPSSPKPSFKPKSIRILSLSLLRGNSEYISSYWLKSPGRPGQSYIPPTPEQPELIY